MRRTALILILILILPTLCWGSVSPELSLEVPGIEWTAFRLDLESRWTADGSRFYVSDLTRSAVAAASKDSASMLRQEFIPMVDRHGPDDMVSMMSFIWAELTGGVDVVAEVKAFSRQWRNRGRTVRTVRSVQTVTRKKPYSRCRWKIIVAYRVDDNLELAARFNARGNLRNKKKMAFELSAADIFPDELGLTTVYRDGSFKIEADKVALTQTAMAKVVVRF